MSVDRTSLRIRATKPNRAPGVLPGKMGISVVPIEEDAT